MNAIKKIFGGDTRQLGMIFALIALIVFFQIKTGLTLDPNNVNNIIQGNAYILVLAIGMVLVIIAGHIDLSVGSIAAFVGIVVAMGIRDWASPGGSASCSAWSSAPSSAPGRVSGSPTSASRPSSSPSPECSSSGEPTSGSASPSPCPCPRPSRSSAPAPSPRSAPTPATTT